MSENTCPVCGKDGGGCIKEIWDASFNQETRWYECPEGHRFSVIQDYRPAGEPCIVEGWEEQDDSLEYGKFYIGCFNSVGKFMCYYWDSLTWGMAEVGNPVNSHITFTRMSVKVAKDTMEEVNAQYPELKLFLIPIEDIKRWGVAVHE